MYNGKEPEYGPWVGYNQQGCPDECVGKRIEICTEEKGNLGDRHASSNKWCKEIVAYRIEIEAINS